MTAARGDLPLIRVKGTVEGEGRKQEGVATYVNLAQILVATLHEDAGGQPTLTIRLPGYSVTVVGDDATALEAFLRPHAAAIPSEEPDPVTYALSPYA